jgi:hypothetical protein
MLPGKQGIVCENKAGAAGHGLSVIVDDHDAVSVAEV